METDDSKETMQLLNSITLKDDNKVTLLEHLQKLYETRTEMGDDQKFLDLFEEISLRLKTDGTYFKKDSLNSSIFNYLMEFNKNIKQKKELIDPLVKKDEEGNDPQPVGEIKNVPEYHNLFQFIEWTGYSLGEKESYLLTNSLRNLCFKQNLGWVRFWGKIYGTKKDYFIAEAPAQEREKKDDSPTDPLIEPRTNEKGVNRYMYYVCSDLTNEWEELDDVKPSQLIAARKVTYTFTGDLNKKIITNPHFPGLEKDYLRCQIARITHNTTIIPLTPAVNGKLPQWKVNPESKREMEKNDEATPVRIQEAINIKNWVHFIPGLLKEGRTVHMEREAPEGVDPEDFKKQIENKDKFDDLLAPIENDMKLTSSIPNIKIPAWKLQFMYDDKVYINPNIKVDLESDPEQKKDNTVNYTIVCLKSLRWPGAIVVRFRGEILNFYFGWGKKFCDTGMDEKFVFKDFQTIQTDQDEYDTFPEPNSPPQELEKVQEGGDPVAD